MTLPEGTTSILLLLLLAAVIVLAVLVVLMGTQLARLRRQYAGAVGRGRQRDVFDVLREHAGDIERLRADLQVVHGNTETIREVLRGTLSRVGVVRYDAFGDMGGKLSFSAALLDERNDGIVLSSISGRSETRTYAKPIRGGRAEQSLSPEEEAAIEAAMHGERGTSRPISRFRRSRQARA